MKEHDRCEHCGIGTLEIVLANEPYTDDHLICNWCDSTYNLG